MANEITEYELGAIYADHDGTLLVCVGFDTAKRPRFLAFGNRTPIPLEILSGNDVPKHLVFDVSGKCHITDLEYPNGTGIVSERAGS